MLAQILHIGRVGKRLVELDVDLVAGFVQQGLHHLPSQTQGHGQVRAHPPGIVEIGCPFVVAEIGSDVTAGLRGGIRACRRNSVRELAV